MKTLIHPALHDITLAGVLYAIGDPIRLQIVRCLAQTNTACCASLAADLPKSTLTRHFRVLREQGVIVQQARGRQLVNTLRRDDLETRFPGLLNAILSCNDSGDSSK
jgi:DNA-binding transcriptional ArsR family regulator